MRTVAVASRTTKGSSGVGDEVVMALANSTATRCEKSDWAESGDVHSRRPRTRTLTVTDHSR